MSENDSNKRRPRLTAKSLGRPEGISGEETRERLLEVAATLFARQGFRGVSLAEIAGAAGLSAPAIYNHFKSKDDLFIEAACDLYEEIRDAFAGGAGAAGSWHDKVSGILGACEELYREDAVLQRFGSVIEVEASRNPERYAPIHQARAGIDRIFQRIVADAVRAGELPTSVDPETAGNLLMSMIMTGIGGRTLSSPTKGDFKKLTAAFKALLGIQTVDRAARVSRFSKRSA